MNFSFSGGDIHFSLPGVPPMMMPPFLQNFFVSLSGAQGGGGFGGPPRDGSHVGVQFDRYMRSAVASRFRPSYSASRDIVDVWRGRRVRVTPHPGAAPAEGTVEKLTQWVRTPFDTTTQ